MADLSVMYSSKTDQWSTPQDFYQSLDDEFHFDLDPCADATNYKCDTYFTKEEDGLLQDWGGHRVFCNPPYGKAISAWVEKCYEGRRSERQHFGRHVNPSTHRYKIFS